MVVICLYDVYLHIFITQSTIFDLLVLKSFRITHLIRLRIPSGLAIRTYTANILSSSRILNILFIVLIYKLYQLTRYSACLPNTTVERKYKQQRQLMTVIAFNCLLNGYD